MDGSERGNAKWRYGRLAQEGGKQKNAAGGGSAATAARGSHLDRGDRQGERERGPVPEVLTEQRSSLTEERDPHTRHLGPH